MGRNVHAYVNLINSFNIFSDVVNTMQLPLFALVSHAFLDV